MQRVSLLQWNNLVQDYDVSKILESLSTAWVAQGLQVQSWKVTKWFWFIEVTRTWKSFRVLFDSDTDVTIDTTGTKKVFVEITQANIDNGTINAPNGEGIGTIKTAASYPTSNYIKLASITSWVITDERVFIKKDYLARNIEETTNARLNVIWLTWNSCVQYWAVTDFNDILIGWRYRVDTWTALNKPPKNWTYILIVDRVSQWSNYAFQMAIWSWFWWSTANEIYTRSMNNNIWTSWEKLITWGVPKLANTPDNRGGWRWPNWYARSLELEFIDASDIALTWTSPGIWLLTLAPWNDPNWSGQTVQFAFANNGDRFYRRSTNNTTWGLWEKEWVKPITMGFQNPSYVSWNQDITYNHSFGSIPNSIEFYFWWAGKAVWTKKDNTQRFISYWYNWQRTASTWNLMSRLYNNNWNYLVMTLLSVTSTQFTIRYFADSSTSYPNDEILVTLS